MTFSELFTLIRWDLRVNKGLHFDSLRARLLLAEIRSEQFVYSNLAHRGVPGRALWYLCRFLGSIFQWLLSNSNIPGSIRIGRGLRLPHPQNIIIAFCAEIGEFCTIYQNVSIAWNHFLPFVPLSPKIGDQVLLGTGAIVLGDISIGSHTLVGAGAVVTKSVPEYSRVTSARMCVTSRPPSPDAPEPGSNRHLNDLYSIWR
jgi:serine acetyltransferase